MALDIFVMPLWKYLVGDFMTAAERLCAEMGVPEKYHRVGGEKPGLTEMEARQYVVEIQEEMARELGMGAKWPDEGDEVFGRQFPRDYWHALRAFAADQQYPQPGFVFGEDSHEHPGLGRIWGGAESQYLHLIVHQDHCGYYLPCEFDEPLALKTGEDSPPVCIGSSVALLRELNTLGAKLRMRNDLEDSWGGPFDENDPLNLAKSGWAFMHYCARLSVGHRLPIIFDG